MRCLQNHIFSSWRSMGRRSLKTPSFVIKLRIRAQERKWDAPGDQGILNIDGKNILTEYHSITETQINTASTACTNNHSIKKKVTSTCINYSIKGNLKDTIFNQFGNIPSHNNGIALSKQLAKFLQHRYLCPIFNALVSKYFELWPLQVLV